MMRGMVFAKRTGKEILRNPLSYVFCLGFPIIMLVIMTLVDQSVPKEAEIPIFHMDQLAPGITFFGLSFVMIFTCIQVSSDRQTALLMRLHASPMGPADFIFGYTVPVFFISLTQSVITYLASVLIGIATEDTFSFLNIWLSILCMVPGMIGFLSIGLIFGTLLNEKAASGLCSVIVTVAGMLGGIWMPVDIMGGTILKVSKCMPFYYGVKAARIAVAGDYKELLRPFFVTLIWAVCLYLTAVFVMYGRLKKDIS